MAAYELTIVSDLVQDMYLRELKSYKPPQIKASDAEGQVHKFSMPKLPASPEESDLAQDLKAYESQTVEIEGQSDSGQPEGKEEDWFEMEEEEDGEQGHETGAVGATH